MLSCGVTQRCDQLRSPPWHSRHFAWHLATQQSKLVFVQGAVHVRAVEPQADAIVTAKATAKDQFVFRGHA